MFRTDMANSDQLLGYEEAIKAGRSTGSGALLAPEHFSGKRIRDFVFGFRAGQGEVKRRRGETTIRFHRQDNGVEVKVTRAGKLSPGQMMAIARNHGWSDVEPYRNGGDHQIRWVWVGLKEGQAVTDSGVVHI